MNRAYRKELMKTHWLVQFGFCIIPESWYAKNDRAVKKTKHRDEDRRSVRIGMNQMRLSDQEKEALMGEIEKVVECGIVEKDAIYFELELKKLIPMRGNMLMSKRTFYSYVYTVKRERCVKPKTLAEMSIAMYEEGVREKKKIAEMLECTVDTVHKALVSHGLIEKRVHQKQGAQQ